MGQMKNKGFYDIKHPLINIIKSLSFFDPPFLEAWAEIKQIFRSFLGGSENMKI